MGGTIFLLSSFVVVLRELLYDLWLCFWHWVSGGVIAFLVGLVIIGGIKRIAAVASKLVPTMAVLYVAGALVILFTHFENTCYLKYMFWKMLNPFEQLIFKGV